MPYDHLELWYWDEYHRDLPVKNLPMVLPPPKVIRTTDHRWDRHCDGSISHWFMEHRSDGSVLQNMDALPPLSRWERFKRWFGLKYHRGKEPHGRSCLGEWKEGRHRMWGTPRTCDRCGTREWYGWP